MAPPRVRLAIVRQADEYHKYDHWHIRNPKLGLDPTVASVVIVLSTLLFILPVAWMRMMGPKTGMSQMAQTRYYFCYYLSIGIALLQIATLIGYTIMTSIVSGSTLTAGSEGDLSLIVGITISVVGALPISFLGHKYLHYID
ncbi:NCS1 nucleoside transporter [Colletotrichum tamarilloi]|uniref:NCS1 nucleoside transporter n=1 Tax=Colletotrichum tamarilloi TaxID=1209934 RepID=A0ABQ9QUC1_9PEZI|nr:NCS1 nucleoside transporter [Colletotrichum tamarilloi]KAK1485389.1 NCS1 nucleoside transporter [Colletotrichum tamarilloi]